MCRQFFSLNYGIVKYVEWSTHKANEDRLPNPIIYTYLKDIQFSEERELRISLSTEGIGSFMLNNGSTIQFPKSVQFTFDFREALSRGIILRILFGQDCNLELLKHEFCRRHIKAHF